MKRINEWYPVLTDEALQSMDGFTVLAKDVHTARKLILESIEPEDFEDIELMGSWAMDDWETQDRLELQGYY